MCSLSVCAATTYNWTNSSSSGASYSVATNWSPNTVPADTSANAWITNGGTILFNGNFTNNQLYVAPVNGSSGTFKMSGGNLWVSTNNLFIGGTAQTAGVGSTGEFIQTGGTLVVQKNGVKDVMILGQANNSSGTFTISNGTAVVYGGLEIAFYGTGTLNVNGGTLIAHSWFQPGRGQGAVSGSGFFNMTGGTTYILRNANNENNNTRGLYLAQAGTNGVVNISGGTLICNRIAFASSGVAQNQQLNVSGGDIYVAADGISGYKPGVSSVNISGGTFHTVDMLATVPSFPGDLSSILSDGTDWTWTDTMVILMPSIPGLGGVGYVTFAPEAGHTITLNNEWGGTGGFVVAGPGTVAMAGTNFYGGDTTINGGRLAFIGGGQLWNNFNIIIGAGGVLDASQSASPLSLYYGQTITNATSPAQLAGSFNAANGVLSLRYVPGTPSLTISNGTLSFSTNSLFYVNNTGSALAPGNYKIISATAGGAVSGASLPSVTVNGGGVASGQFATLGVIGNELYLVVTNNRPPVIANNITATVNAGASWQIAISDLRAQAGWSDPDNDSVSFYEVDATSINGISVTTDGTNIYYAGPMGADDSFNYTITDGKLTASGTVYLDLSTATLGWAMMPSDSNYVVSLNGNWDFYYEKLSTYYTGSAPSVFLVDSSQDFQSTNYVEGAGWTNIAVPSNWEMDGFSPCTYAQVDKTSGLYRYWVTVPGSWQGRMVYLNFDGVQTSAEVWLNGQPVDVNEPTWGISNYHESGWTAFQADLTPQIKFGTSNLLAIRVIKNMPAVDLDTGDYFSLGGIFRPVTMYSVPFTNFADVQITTHILSNNQAEVDVTADVNNGDASTSVSLTLNNVTTTLNATNGQARFTNIVNQPLLWSAEFPNLYPYSVQLKDSHSAVTETVSNRLGIREITISNGVLYLNGVPIKMAGVCNHDSWAATGNAVTSNQWRQDILMMKAANINAIRTTHYNFGSGFFDLCDELGMYVADELPYCWSDNETGNLNYETAYLQRADEVLRRDRNHPSVMIWAIGNENNTGTTQPLTNLQAVANLVQSLDPTRPRLVSCFPASQYNVELGDRHYPTTNQMVSDALAAPGTGNPYIYMEQPNTWDVRLAADASMWERWGLALQRVWSVCMKYDTIVGTFPFEWSDRAVADPNPISSYSMNGVQNLYSFPSGIRLLKCKGMVDGFRNPRPSVYETKMLYSPIQFTNVLTVSGNGQLSFPVTNQYCFTDLSYLTLQWQLQRNGIVLTTGSTQQSVAPRTNGIVQFTVPTDALASADSVQVDFIHPNGIDVVTGRFVITNIVRSALSTNLPSNLPIPQLNLIVRQTVSDPGLWQTVLHYPSTLANVTLTPSGATTLGQLQSMSANIMGGTAGTQIGTLSAQYTNNQFSYTINWTGANALVQELGWTFQMPNAYTNFSWDRAARWSYYTNTSIARATGTANPASMNADISGMFAANSFDFNSTKYDCNWASLTSGQGDGLRVQFSPAQRFQCRGGTNAQGNILYVNQQVCVADNDFTTQIVPDQILTLRSGNVMSGSFTVGSMSNLLFGATVTLSNLFQNYDGAPKSVPVTTVPAGLSTWITYNGTTNSPSAPGAYTVIATVTDPNYQGSVTNTMVISLGALRLLNTTPNADGSMTFGWNAISGNSYALEYKNSLSDPQWLTLSTGLAPSGGKITVSDPSTNSQRFYRIESAAGVSDIAGYIRLPFLGDSDNFASFPFVRPGATLAEVGSVASNVITVAGFPDWAVNQFVYAAGTQTNSYYVRMTSGAAEGKVWSITANAANSLTVDISASDLSGVAPGDIISIEASWSFATGFDNGAAVNVSPTIGTRNTEVLIPDFSATGINLSAAKIYFYNSGIWKIVGEGNANHSDDVLTPYGHFIVRHNVATNTQWLVYGTVIQNKIAIPLRAQPSVSQDNYIGLMRPNQMSLNDSGLITSGAFSQSTLPGSRTDELQVFDNTIIGKNKSASAIYYYWNNAWRSVGTGSSDVGNVQVFQPGLGVILRKATNNTSPAWINDPNW